VTHRIVEYGSKRLQVGMYVSDDENPHLPIIAVLEQLEASLHKPV